MALYCLSPKKYVIEAEILKCKGRKNIFAENSFIPQRFSSSLQKSSVSNYVCFEMAVNKARSQNLAHCRVDLGKIIAFHIDNCTRSIFLELEDLTIYRLCTTK